MARKKQSSSAAFSPCRTWRYNLRRVVNPDAVGLVSFIGLNPSTADETKDDPTIRRCIRFARDWGFGTLMMLNAYAYRSTDPKKLWEVDDPIGPHNNAYIAATCEVSNLVICAWGANIRASREEEIMWLLDDPRCLGLTRDGHPRHPLYVRADTATVPFNG